MKAILPGTLIRYATRSCAFVACLMLCGLVSTTAMASEYPLDSVAFLTEKEVSALKKLPASSTHDAGKALAAAKARKKASKKIGMKAKRLDTVAKLFDLMRVEGVGPKMAQLFNAAGVASCAALAKENAEELAKRLLETNSKQSIANKIPDATILKDWISQATALPEQYRP